MKQKTQKKILQSILFLMAFILMQSTGWSETTKPQLAAGKVFDDQNKNGTLDSSEPGIPDILVSNGKEIVKTDQNGNYQILVNDDTIIFVIKPTGWMFPLTQENLPMFYYIHKPNGSPKFEFNTVSPTGPLPESINFPLYPQDEPENFKVLLFGDPQVGSQTQIDYAAHDVIEEVIGTDAAFGISLGDNAGNKLSLFENLNKVTGLIGIPWFNLIGNHDLNFDSPNDKLSNETFESVYGPSYYSFNFGKTHFIVMDDINWLGAKKQDDGSYYPYSYRSGVDPDQLEFIKKDLELVPDNQLVVLLMHIALVSQEGKMNDNKKIFKLVEDRSHIVSIAGHSHAQEYVLIDKKNGWKGSKPLLQFVSGTVCGNWWIGLPDEVGLPHATMYDGTPNGYSILSITGNEYSIEFKAARRPADYQMNIFAPEEISFKDFGKTPILVNVFAGSEKSKVEMRVGKTGEWITMKKVVKEDPYYLKIRETDSKIRPDHAPLPEAVKCMHLWEANLPKGTPEGTTFIEVKTTDIFGHTYTGYRAIRIEE